MTEKLITASAVTELTNIPQGSLYRFVNEGRFPRPLKIGKRSVRWVASEVEDWLQERMQEREPEPASVG